MDRTWLSGYFLRKRHLHLHCQRGEHCLGWRDLHSDLWAPSIALLGALEEAGEWTSWEAALGAAHQAPDLNRATHTTIVVTMPAF